MLLILVLCSVLARPRFARAPGGRAGRRSGAERRFARVNPTEVVAPAREGRWGPQGALRCGGAGGLSVCRERDDGDDGDYDGDYEGDHDVDHVGDYDGDHDGDHGGDHGPMDGPMGPNFDEANCMALEAGAPAVWVDHNQNGAK